MKKLLWAWLLATALPLQAQTKAELLLWDSDPTENSAEKAEAVRNNDFTRDPGITVYIPDKPNGTAILMCPGGGYAWEATGHEGHDLAQWFCRQGITYAVLKYRLPQGNRTLPLADAEQGMRLLRANAEKWGIDPSRVGVMGASAGGHLASTLATHYSSPETRPDFQVLLYPVITMNETSTHMGSRINLLGDNPTKEIEKEFSNELRVTPDTPRALILLSADDDVVPVANSVNYFNALLDNHVGASLHIYPCGGHGWGYGDGFQYKSQWTEEVEKWLRDEIK